MTVIKSTFSRNTFNCVIFILIGELRYNLIIISEKMYMQTYKILHSSIYTKSTFINDSELVILKHIIHNTWSIFTTKLLHISLF